ncbi:MarR family winged helix-turn-helix transcriptional regulator [Pseudonocardia sp. CA-107938]|uniref:MarR family winged helix-turn-helix transcriptional regulator n=1 Tax=Pseudonocardia sp. CA-107938 TaxID=3240021 RepID=UPI003D91165C
MNAEAPRWLDEQEMSTWMALLCVMTWLPHELDAQLQRDAGISHFEYGLLAQLSASPNDEARISDLARVGNGALPRVSKALDRFEQHGWITRRPDPSDGRYTLATLTPEGRALVERTAPGHVEQVRRLVFDRLTPSQVRQLGRIAGTIEAAVRPAPRSRLRP